MKLTIEKCPGRRYNPSRSKLLSAVLFSSASAVVLALASGCALTRQETITGEPVLHSIDPTSGSLYDRDILPNGEDAQGIIPHEGEIITVVVHDIFLKYLKESSTPHVLVYAEVYDDGTDNPETAVSKVLWNELNQPSGVRLGLADRVLYGPTPYKGFPLRIRLYIVELDKEEKKAASALINAAGTIASAAQPEAAPAIGIIVQAAQAINALNEDDFELRFDLTLHPIGRFAEATINQAGLEGLDQPEPVQRVGRSIAIAAPLRTGSFAVLKRELDERSTAQDHRSLVQFDWAQEGFIRPYDGMDGNEKRVIEFLRMQGGRLMWVVGKTEPVEVYDQTVRGQRIPTLLTSGIRKPFTDQTHVTFSVITGLPMGLNQDALRAASDRDARAIAGLLDNPDRTPRGMQIAENVDQVAQAIKTHLEQRAFAQGAARKVGSSPEFRNDPAYARYWLEGVQSLTNFNPATMDFRNAVARNAAIIPVLDDLIINLPVLRADNPTDVQALLSIAPDDISSVDGKAGRFELNRNALDRLRGRGNP